MKQILCLSSLAILCALVTGCPSNDYTVDLKPQADGSVERMLTFYRADGGGTNGVPNYAQFPSNELTAIVSVYPAGAVKTNGLRYVAVGDFTGSMPQDIGGVGSYTNFVTSLGDARFYMERFRGNDDLAAITTNRLHAADQIDDLIMGWTKTEFGREHGYGKLRKFLDTEFRHDLKNATLYLWMQQVSDLSETNAPNEFIARLLLNFSERGYLKLSDVPELYSYRYTGENSAAILHLIQRLIAEKMEIPSSDPLPKSFAVLNSQETLSKSWDQYMVGTDLYRDQMKEWKKSKEKDPMPLPIMADAGLWGEFLFGNEETYGGADHLTVKLALAHAPHDTNGKWRNGEVIWSDDLVVNRPLPAFCFASWSSPNTEFQTKHFGKVILDGEELSQYCFWQRTVGPKQFQEWESFLETLKPGQDLGKNLQTFHFSTAVASASTNEDQTTVGRRLVLEALGNQK